MYVDVGAWRLTQRLIYDGGRALVGALTVGGLPLSPTDLQVSMLAYRQTLTTIVQPATVLKPIWSSIAP